MGRSQDVPGCETSAVSMDDARALEDDLMAL